MANAFLLRPLAVASVTTFGTLIRGAVEYVTYDLAGLTCRLACDAGTEAVLRIDLGADQVIDTVMAFGVSSAPAGGLVNVFTATTAAPNAFTLQLTDSPLAGTVARADALGVTLGLLPAPVSARYVQLSYIAPGPGAFVEISRIVIGRRFQPAIGFEYGGQFGVRDLGALDVNARGVLLRHRGKKLRTVSLNFPSLTKQEAEGTAQKLLEQVGNTECIALCTDPTPDPERQSRCYFGPLVGDLTRTWASARGHEVRVSLLGLL